MNELIQQERDLSMTLMALTKLRMAVTLESQLGAQILTRAFDHIGWQQKSVAAELRSMFAGEVA